MRIISSQHYIDWDIVESKIESLANVEKVIIPCSYVGFIDGEEYAMQIDGHHTLAAAKELGLEIEYSIEDDVEGLTGNDLLDARYMDGDWYAVETSEPANDSFDLVW